MVESELARLTPAQSVALRCVALHCVALHRIMFDYQPAGRPHPATLRLSLAC